MGITILGNDSLSIETGPRSPIQPCHLENICTHCNTFSLKYSQDKFLSHKGRGMDFKWFAGVWINMILFAYAQCAQKYAYGTPKSISKKNNIRNQTLHIYQREMTQICTNMHMFNRYQPYIDTDTCVSAFKAGPRQTLNISDFYWMPYQKSNKAFIKPRLTIKY